MTEPELRERVELVLRAAQGRFMQDGEDSGNARLVLGGLLVAMWKSWDTIANGPSLLRWTAIGIAAFFLAIIIVLFVLYVHLPSSPGGFEPRWRKRHRLPFRKVAWNLNNYLSCSGERHGETLVVGFHAKMLITRGDGIHPKQCYIECRRTSTKQDVKINVFRSGSRDDHKRAEDIEFLPRDIEPYYGVAWFEKDGVHNKSSGMTKEVFLKRYDGMRFVFEYDETYQEINFSRGELEAIIDRNWQYMNGPPRPTPTLRNA